MKNTLYYGDNLAVMEKMPKWSVDLIYLDPPFKSEQNYNLIYKNLTGRPIPEQAEAFCDTWEMDDQKLKMAKAMPVLMREHGVAEYYVQFWRLWMDALRLTQPHLLAYLIYMVQRLLHMKIILKPTGSIYLHCDPTASHYIKVMMDGIFGHDNFRNEIAWKRTFAHGSASRWGDIHDTLLFYSMGDEYTWNRDVTQAHDPDYLDVKYRYRDQRGRFRYVVLTGPGKTKGDSGKPWRGYDPSGAGRHWTVPRRALAVLKEEGVSYPNDLHGQLEALYQADIIRFPKKSDGTDGVPEFKLYLGEGRPLQDLILDIPPINSQAKERLGYPTQKPIALLRRIIQVSSNEGDVVFDPFCGCGTTIYAAHETGRQWIGCDVAILAVRLVEKELAERYGLIRGEHYTEDGIPNSVESAQALWERDPWQFEHWAAEYVEGFPTKKTRDDGIDGRVYFETQEGVGVMVLSVKGGGIQPRDVRDLAGVVSSEPNTYLGGLITLQEPSKAMLKAADLAGTWEYRGVEYPKVQILTVKQMLEDKRAFLTPTKIGTKSATGQTVLAV